ncbi:hypothetical protein LB504_010617 [Fusarium proliferatum]|nr:hypothetical protein LB504_010617 [Fusarium proliferatum]
MKEADTRAPLILGVILTLLLLTLSIVLLRVYTRAMLLKQFGADDIWAVLSMVIPSFYVKARGSGIKYGFGRHQVFLTEEESRNYFKVFYVSIILYLVSLGAIKTTLLCQYYRAFAINKMKTVLLVAMVFVSAWSISQIFLNIFICTPIAAFWDRTIEGRCIPRNPTWYITAAGNIATDIMIIVIPFPVVIKLNLARRQRFVLLGVFCVGFLQVIPKQSRLYMCHLYGSHGLPRYPRRPDLGQRRTGMLVIHRTLLRAAMRLRPNTAAFRLTILSVNVQL